MPKEKKESDHEGRDRYFVDVDRMINEGLGGGQVTLENGLIEEARELSDETSRPNPSETKQKERQP